VTIRTARRRLLPSLLVAALVATQALLVPAAHAANPTITAPAVTPANVASYVVTGTADLNATLTLSIDDGGDTATTPVTSTTTADGIGNYSFPGVDLTTLGEGVLAVTVIDTADGETGTTTTTKDAAVPGAPTVTAPTAGASVGATVTVTGTAQAGSTVAVRALRDADATEVDAAAPVTAAVDGTYTATLDLTAATEGAFDLEAIATDGAGSSTPTVVTGVLLDVAPAVPVITGPTGGGLIGETVTVTGTAQAEAAVTVAASRAGAPLESTTVTATGGAFSADLDLSGAGEGPVEITAVAADAGGISETATVSVTLDLAPGVPTITAPAADATVGGTFDVTGVAESGATVEVVASSGGTQLDAAAPVTAGGDGIYIATLDLSAATSGPVEITVTATDPGGTSADATRSVVLDVTDPAVTLGPLETVTAGNSVNASGTTEAGATVSVTVEAADGTSLAPVEAEVDETGAWSVSVDPADLAEGLLTVTATATDPVGNQASDTRTVLLDTVAPVVVLDPLAEVETGTTLAVSGSVDEGDEVLVTARVAGAEDGQVVTETVTVTGGLFTVDLDIAVFGDATLEVTATAVDAAGNLGFDTDEVVINTVPAEVSVLADAPVQEGGEPGRLRFIRLDNVLSETLTVTYQVTGQVEAVTLGDGTIEIPAGATWATLDVVAADDDAYERTATVVVSVVASAEPYTVAPGATSATLLVVDDEIAPPVSISVEPASLQEDEDGEATFTVSRTDTSAGSLVVMYQRSGGADDPTGALGDFTTDYNLAASGSMGYFLLGETQTSLSFTVDPVEDSLFEEDDALQLTLTEASGYTIAAESVAVFTIVNDDVAPTPEPTEQPTEQPTEGPTEQPTDGPTDGPTEEPTDGPTDTPEEVVEVAPDAGGEADVAVVLPEGTVTLELSGVEGTGTITVDREVGIPEEAPEGVTLLPVYFEFTESPGLSFDEVTVTLPYDEQQVAAAGLDERGLAGIHILDDGSVEDFTGEVDTEANEVSGTVTEFSTFALGSYDIERLGGENRYETAARISAETFPADVEVAYVATGDAFPDALTGGPAAGRDGAPILLVGDDVPAATAAELTRLNPGRIVVLGGEVAVSAQVEAALAAYTDGGVTRLAGADRFGTAAAIAGAWDETSTVYVATGANFPDALAGAAAAGLADAPLLLVGADVPATTAAELQRLDPDRIILLGGTVAVSTQVEATLRATGATVERLAGTDRYDTAATVAESFATGGAAYVATGTNFPDALTGAPAAIQDGAPVLLVDTNAVPAPTAERLEALDPERLVVLGGPAAVSAQVELDLRPSLLE